MIEKTLVLVKPDGIKRGLVGEILSRFEKMGLKIIGMKMIKIDPEFSKKHYSENVEKYFYEKLERYITSGPVVAIVFEGINAVEVVRKVAGATEPKAAETGTIRGDYSHISLEYSDFKQLGARNLVHASGNKEEAEKEIKLWFKKEELCEYKTLYELHVESDDI